MSDLAFLVDGLRNYLGDYSSPYRFTDEALEISLSTALNMLLSRLNYKYSIDEDGIITRTSGGIFKLESPPVIEYPDQASIVIQGAIITKTATAWDSSWDVASWRDDEVSYSNIQGARSRDQSITNDLKLLEDILKKRLHPGKISQMVGFHLPRNTIENL